MSKGHTKRRMDLKKKRLTPKKGAAIQLEEISGDLGDGTPDVFVEETNFKKTPGRPAKKK